MGSNNAVLVHIEEYALTTTAMASAWCRACSPLWAAKVIAVADTSVR